MGQIQQLIIDMFIKEFNYQKKKIYSKNVNNINKVNSLVYKSCIGTLQNEIAFTTNTMFVD